MAVSCSSQPTGVSAMTRGCCSALFMAEPTMETMMLFKCIKNLLYRSAIIVHTPIVRRYPFADASCFSPLTPNQGNSCARNMFEAALSDGKDIPSSRSGENEITGRNISVENNEVNQISSARLDYGFVEMRSVRTK